MAYSEPGQYNTFTASADATAYMLTGFGRNIQDFAINRYMEIRPVTKSKGYYLRWKSEQAARVRYSDLRDMVWPDGAERPHGQDNNELFEFEGYTTQRYADSFTLGKKTLEQADWPLHEAQASVIAQQMMTGRTKFASNFLTGATWGANQANVDGAGGALNGNAAILGSGHNWTNGTSTTPYLKISIQFGFNVINLMTLGSINISDLVLVMNPNTAFSVSQSPEVNDIMARSVYALPNLTGEIFNDAYGLPERLYGVKVIVDKTVLISTRKTVAAAPLSSYGYVIPDGAAYLLTRPPSKSKEGKELAFVKENTRPDADLDGNEKDKSNYFPVMSTLVGFFYEEMSIEAKEFPWDRLVSGSVVSDFDMQLSSPKSGFQFLRCAG